MLNQHPFYILLLSFFLIGPLLSQTNVGIKTVIVDGEKAIDQERIEKLAYNVLNSKKDHSKDSINDVLKKILELELSKDIAFKTSFDKIKSISILTPEDSSFRIFNWNIPYSNGTYSYECGILLQNEDQLIFLKNKEETKSFDSTDMWIPALYYTIIMKETRFQKYYTMLGWKGNDRLTTKKVVDILWFSSQGNLKFGAPLFKERTQSINRVVFEFAAQNAMKLSYNKKFDRIEFDHLSPPQQSLSGIYEYYGPDLSFDAYQWENESWVLKEDIDLDKGLKKKKSDFQLDPKSLLELEEKPIYSPK